MNKFNYENKNYLQKLNDLSPSYYSKYIEYIKKYLHEKNLVFLDVGCGNGFVLGSLQKKGYTNGYGIDISRLFIKEAKSKGLKNVYHYGGEEFPFKKNYFDLIGSFNVLEHTHDPSKFIKRQLSLLKIGGFIIITCPNFLSSVIISPHPRVNGIIAKLRNFVKVQEKIFSHKDKPFQMMKPIIRKNFQYDDDAIVITNLMDIKKLLKKNNCKIVYESGFINYDNFFVKLINAIPVVRYSMPSCFTVAKKIK